MTDPYRTPPAGWKPEPFEHAPPIAGTAAWFEHIILANDPRLAGVLVHSPGPGVVSVALTAKPTLLSYEFEIKDAARRLLDRERPAGVHIESITLECL